MLWSHLKRLTGISLISGIGISVARRWSQSTSRNFGVDTFYSRDDKPHVVVVGGGITGSWTTLFLTKLARYIGSKAHHFHMNMLVSGLAYCVWPMWTVATVCEAAGGTPGLCTSLWRTMSGSRWTWSMSMTTSTSRQRRGTTHWSSRRSGECSLDQLSQWQRCMISCQELFTNNVHWNLLVSTLDILQDVKFSPLVCERCLSQWCECLPCWPPVAGWPRQHRAGQLIARHPAEGRVTCFS